MEETLGKRIVANRKRLGITQDRLAEQLGVTAQAVSKWENDQSCPDITMLPKLAQIFGTSVDSLLGLTALEQGKVYEAEVVTEAEAKAEEEPRNKWEFHYDASRKGSLAMAIWVLAVGSLMLANIILNWEVGLWDIAWPSAVLMFGLCGLYPKFSFFNLGCALFGGYFLLENLGLTSLGLSSELVLPVVVILFGLSLLADALHKPKKHRFSVTHNGRNISNTKSNCSFGDESFDSVVSFGEGYHLIDLPRLSAGTATISFGEATVDLTACGQLASNCTIEATCSFGELTLRVPRRFRVESSSSTAFASVDVSGHPDPEPEGVIFLNATASFGEIGIDYI